jgi:hypothetical protein
MVVSDRSSKREQKFLIEKNFNAGRRYDSGAQEKSPILAPLRFYHH